MASRRNFLLMRCLFPRIVMASLEVERNGWRRRLKRAKNRVVEAWVGDWGELEEVNGEIR